MYRRNDFPKENQAEEERVDVVLRWMRMRSETKRMDEFFGPPRKTDSNQWTFDYIPNRDLVPPETHGEHGQHHWTPVYQGTMWESVYH